MSLITYKKIIKLIFLIIFILPIYAQALEKDGVNFILKPNFPNPNEDVLVNIESYSTNLDKAEITWFQNDLMKKRGFGAKSFSFKTNKLGTSEDIVVQIITDDNEVVFKSINIRPTTVDLIWEANSFVPPLYKGKILNTYQSDIKIVAIPRLIDEDGSFVDSDKLLYKWKKDWKILNKESGYGKKILEFKKPQFFRDTIINLEVETTDGLMKTSKSIVIKNHKPKIIFYKNDPLLGVVYENAIKEYLLGEEEVEIKAFPMFFSKGDVVKYDWIMNGKKIDPQNKSSVIFKKSKNTGITNISLEIKNLSRIMQFAKNNFRLNATQGEKNNLFGNI